MSKVAAFSRMFEPLVFVSEGVFGTRSGDIGCVLKFGGGPDSEAAMEADVDAIAARWRSAHRAVPEGVRVASYLQKRRCGGTYAIDRHLCLIYQGADSEHMRSAATAFVAALADAIPVSLCTSQEALDFFRRITGVDCSIPRCLRPDVPIGRHLDTAVEGHRDYIMVNDKYVRVLTLKELRSGTDQDLLARCRLINAEFTVCVEWRPLHPREARKMAESKAAHFHRRRNVFSLPSAIAGGLMGLMGGAQQQATEEPQKDESATGAEEELMKEVLRYLDAGGTLGDLAVTIICPGDTPRNALDLAQKIQTSFVTDSADCWMYLEQRNTLNAWFSALPGGYRRQLRAGVATGDNAASFAPIFGPEPGACDALATLVTREHTPYGLSLHHQDVGHFVLTGATGSGKTFTSKYLLRRARDKGAQIFIFDLKTSYEELAREFGGSIVRLGYGSEPRMNPFRLDDPKFLKVFVRALLECGGAPALDDDDQAAVSDAVDRLYDPKFPVESRRLSMLGLPRNLQRRMEKWLIGGDHGSLFDNHSDDLEVSDFQVFSFPALAEGSAIPEELEPLLLYVFHRVTATVIRGDRSRWKVCLLDEAWRLLQSAAVKNYVIGAVKTWREYNGSLGLATQSSGDFDPEVLQAVVENAGSLLFLANPRMNRAEYERIFHLTPRETELIAGLQPKSEILIKRLDHTKVARLVVATGSNAEAVKEKALASHQ